MVEKDVVPHLSTNADRPGKRLKSSPRIHREVVISVGQAHSVGEARSRVVIGDAEVLESDLASEEHAERPRASLELWPKKAVQSTEVSGHQLSSYSIGKGGGEVPLKIVSHFRFQLHVAVNVEGSPAA